LRTAESSCDARLSVGLSCGCVGLFADIQGFLADAQGSSAISRAVEQKNRLAYLLMSARPLGNSRILQTAFCGAQMPIPFLHPHRSRSHPYTPETQPQAPKIPMPPDARSPHLLPPPHSPHPPLLPPRSLPHCMHSFECPPPLYSHQRARLCLFRCRCLLCLFLFLYR